MQLLCAPFPLRFAGWVARVSILRPGIPQKSATREAGWLPRVSILRPGIPQKSATRKLVGLRRNPNWPPPKLPYPLALQFPLLSSAARSSLNPGDCLPCRQSPLPFRTPRSPSRSLPSHNASSAPDHHALCHPDVSASRDGRICVYQPPASGRANQLNNPRGVAARPKPAKSTTCRGVDYRILCFSGGPLTAKSY